MLLLPRFAYQRPKDLKETIKILRSTKESVAILAGGTDVIVQMKKKLMQPSLLLDIKSISKLKQISTAQNGELVLGATVTLAELQKWARERQSWSGLAIAAATVGSEQVRNRGTVVGNVCRASPAGDMAPILIAMDAKAEIIGPQGKKLVLIENFMTGPGQTVLTQREMVASLRIPEPLRSGTSYQKYGLRRAMEIALVSVAVRISIEKNSNKIGCARIVLGAVAPTPLRVPEAELVLVEEGLNPSVLEKISSLANNYAKPITDIRATGSYRSELIKVLTKRAVKEAWEKLTKREDFLYAEDKT